MTESTMNVSSPWCRTVQLVCHFALRATRTSGCRATADRRNTRAVPGRRRWAPTIVSVPLDPKELGRLEQRLDLGRRPLAAGRDLLAAAVDPDRRHLELGRRLDVGVQPGRHVDPA